MALKVIGAGLGRTGTLSLKLALEHIGLGPCYHMTEIMSQARTRLPAWFGVVQGSADWDAIFEGFNATVDYPTCTYWRELAGKYPDAKVILSIRDAEGWYDSIRQTIFSPQNIRHFMESPVAEFIQGAVIGPFIDHLDERDWMIDFYNRWNDEVIAAMPPGRLLVHQAKEGWEPLCDFLGAPLPAEPYPRVNSKDVMAEKAQTRHGDEEEATLPASPAEMEERMQAYLAAMNKLAWG